VWYGVLFELWIYCGKRKGNWQWVPPGRTPGAALQGSRTHPLPDTPQSLAALKHAPAAHATPTRAPRLSRASPGVRDPFHPPQAFIAPSKARPAAPRAGRRAAALHAGWQHGREPRSSPESELLCLQHADDAVDNDDMVFGVLLRQAPAPAAPWRRFCHWVHC
jgi:hypothetical protein